MKKKKLIIALAALLAVFLIIPTAVSGMIYETIFDRYETRDPNIKHLSDYEGLEVEDVKYLSYQGNRLAGYIYTNEDVEDYAGVIILAHGLFRGGHISYLDVIDYFTSCGFIVFAYDATGNDASEGRSVRGIPQGVMDLDTAIHYIEDPDFGLSEYPICLWGHSWGAYSACAVLNYHPEIKAVVSCSGFNRSSDMLESKGVQYAGNIARAGLFYVNLYERIKFGKYAAASALKGFEGSDAKIMVIHSEDDRSVPIEYGYDQYFEKYGNDPRFTFCLFNDRAHLPYYDSTENGVLDKELFDKMAEIYTQ